MKTVEAQASRVEVMARLNDIATREVCRVILSAAKDLGKAGRFFAALRMTVRAMRCSLFGTGHVSPRPHAVRNEHARSGHTLIEMLVALMLITFVFGTIGLMMHVAGDANRRVRDEVELEHGLSRFAAQLRSDAHQAQSATTRDSAAPQARASVLSLALPEQRTIEYALVPHRVGRGAPRGGRVAPRDISSARVVLGTVAFGNRPGGDDGLIADGTGGRRPNRPVAGPRHVPYGRRRAAFLTRPVLKP